MLNVILENFCENSLYYDFKGSFLKFLIGWMPCNIELYEDGGVLYLVLFGIILLKRIVTKLLCDI